MAVFMKKVFSHSRSFQLQSQFSGSKLVTRSPAKRDFASLNLQLEACSFFLKIVFSGSQLFFSA
jgi:hypothetical protein